MAKRLIVLGLAAALLAGCGGYGHKKKHGGGGYKTNTSAAAGAPVKTVMIDETEFKLTPNAVSLSKPGTYVFKGVNKGTVHHALAVEGHGVDMDSTPVGPGKTTTLKVTLTKSGGYQLYCPVDGHEMQGMKGTVTLGSGGASPPATTTTGTSTGHGY